MLDKDTRVKTSLGTLVAIWAATISITTSVVMGWVSMHQDMNRFHADCENYFKSSWHIADEVERVHQLRDAHGVEPDASEVLRVTRQQQKEN